MSNKHMRVCSILSTFKCLNKNLQKKILLWPQDPSYYKNLEFILLYIVQIEKKHGLRNFFCGSYFHFLISHSLIHSGWVFNIHLSPKPNQSHKQPPNCQITCPHPIWSIWHNSPLPSYQNIFTSRLILSWFYLCLQHPFLFCMILSVGRPQAPYLFSIYTLPRWSYTVMGSKYQLYTVEPQLCIFSPDHSPELQIHVSNGLFVHLIRPLKLV